MELTTTLPSGVWPVMLTPLHDDGAIDWAGLDALTEWYLQAGVSGLFAVCLSSEMYLLTPEERLQVASHVIARVNGRVPVVATGTYGGPVPEQAEFVRRISDAGMRAIVIVTCQLASAAEPEAVFMARMEALLGLTGAIDLGLYECPAPYKRILSAEVYGALAHTGRFVFHKDTTCDAAAMRLKLIAGQGTRLNLYNANTPTALATLQLGAAGVSCIAANVYPELLVWLCRNWESQPAKAERMQRMLTLLDLVVSAKYPTSAKRMLQMRGLPISLMTRGGVAAFNGEDAVQHANALAVVDELMTLCVL